MKQGTLRNILAVLESSAAVAILVAGCGKAESASPRKLASVGGPLEVRPLPLPSQVATDYEAWLKASAGPRVLLYEVTLTNAASQVNYTNRIHLTDSPLGQSWISMTSFRYVFSSNEVAKFQVSEQGKRDASLMRVREQPVKIFIKPIKLLNTTVPEFVIVAVEGEPRGPIPASVPSEVP